MHILDIFIGDDFKDAIQRKTELFRAEMTKAGFTILGQD